MQQFWWVNHNQTARQEIDGQYLWSPKTESNGSRSEFYNNMRRAVPGDLVLSYAGQAVRYVGRVVDFAFTAPKPAEFGNTGGNWSLDGWLLPVFWTPLGPPVRPKEFIASLRPLLPQRYSPINLASGAGNQKAYLAAIPKTVFDLVVSRSSYNDEALLFGGSNSLTFEVVVDKIEDIIESHIREDRNLEDTVKQSVVLARRGQGRFRTNVESIEKSCRLTGVTNPTLLIASHIKPWRLCETAHERLDGMNGLLLTPDADLLFDRGFISFDDDGAVRVSPRIDRTDLRRLGFDQLAWEPNGFAEMPAAWEVSAFPTERRGYLAFHRTQVFIN